MIYAHDSDELEPWFERAVYRANPPIPKPALDNPLTDPLPAAYFTLDLPGKVLLRSRGLKAVHQGNHSAEYVHRSSVSECDIVIYHYPVRSRLQFRQKILQGGSAYNRNPELAANVGWHWRRWYRKVQEGDIDTALADALPSSADLASGVRAGEIVRDDTMARDLAKFQWGAV